MRLSKNKNPADCQGDSDEGEIIQFCPERHDDGRGDRRAVGGLRHDAGEINPGSLVFASIGNYSSPIPVVEFLNTNLLFQN